MKKKVVTTVTLKKVELVLCFSMGQQLSITRKNRRKTHKLFNSKFFLNGNNTLSHTFAVFDEEPIIELININSANENELLKVPEIDLELSKDIIKHRKIIGYFHRVEDLVIVPGMGAERLERIRPRVCTNSKNVMRSSFQSFDSLNSVGSIATITKSNKLVNVNKASIFELQLVHGITQEVAANIVYYRNKKGPFKKVS
ncbi:hypothetical protein HHI36_005323 [Cryptolaemus montrouzieri]|uniref:Uncharacterized protein n=1 Tax=Cryptolaemus montrouzieri TaxID=559131 RepID=A0ABD2NTS2_9CUCU